MNFRNSEYEPDSYTINSNNLISQYKLSMAVNYRKIYIIDSITTESVFEYIYYLNKIVESDKLHNEKKPIEIFVNSGGGSVINGFALISFIEQLKDSGYQIITINMGLAGSMSFVISICGSIRKAYRYARYMCHDISFEAVGKSKEIADVLKESMVIREIYSDIIKKYSNISDDDLTEIFDKKIDRYYSPEELMNMNGVDEIL